jgi:hypothetical protein
MPVTLTPAQWAKLIASGGNLGKVRKNPRGKRRKNPRPRERVRPASRASVGGAAILYASRGRTVLHFNGQHFAARGSAKEFPTMLEAYKVGERLLGAHPVLRRYRLYVKPAR